MAIAYNKVQITNVAPWDCVPLVATVNVSYTNANGVNGVVSLACGSANAVPDQPAAGPSGNLTFTLTHVTAGSGHTLEAVLKHGGVAVANWPVSPVGIGNPCAIVVEGVDGAYDGLPALGAAAALSGTYDQSVGNGILLLVEEPAGVVGGQLRPPRLVFADPAAVNDGKWKHPAIPNVKKGQHLRVVLTRDGVVKTAVRAIFQ